LCLTTVVQLKGQTQFHETNKIIPPSPTATGLGIYGSVPINMYNGSPNINIPIYDISTASNLVKIFMQYDASGTRVQQDASWSGLGWSLNAGGVITRTVKQIDDFKSNGYFFAGPLPPAGYQGNYAIDVYNGNVDGEQDVFNFNFNSYSGRFVLGKKVDGAKVFMDEKSNLKIEYLDTQGKWVITTADGYVFKRVQPKKRVQFCLSKGNWNRQSHRTDG
jgi:hypothetical protein